MSQKATPRKKNRENESKLSTTIRGIQHRQRSVSTCLSTGEGRLKNQWRNKKIRVKEGCRVSHAEEVGRQDGRGGGDIRARREGREKRIGRSQLKKNRAEGADTQTEFTKSRGSKTKKMKGGGAGRRPKRLRRQAARYRFGGGGVITAKLKGGDQMESFEICRASEKKVPKQCPKLSWRRGHRRSSRIRRSKKGGKGNPQEDAPTLGDKK